MAKTINTFDENLNPLLETASNEDLDPLVQYINLKALPFPLSMGLKENDLYIAHQPNHAKYANVIAHEIREFGGNTFVNIGRGGGPSYLEVLRDVADRFGVKYNKTDTAEAVETDLILKVAKDAWEKMSADERKEFNETLGQKNAASVLGSFPAAAVLLLIKSSGFAAYRLSLIVANAVARQLLGKGLSFATNAALTRSLSILAGPIGWAITALWTLYDFSGPAYRITIPCVLHIAMLRRRAMFSICPNCGADNNVSARFCSECGHSLQRA